MGNTSCEFVEDAPLAMMERMVITFPRALFEEVIAKLEEKRTSPSKKRKKRKKLFSRLKKHKSYDDDDTSSPSDTPEIQPGTLEALQASSPIEISQPQISESQTPQLSQPSQTSTQSLEPISSNTDHRPLRESKKKFYELLSSVIAGDPCPSHFEGSQVNQVKANLSKLLSKQQKQSIIKSLSCQRHFPAEIITIEGKGTGVRTLRPLTRCQFICEYRGELLTKTEALRREKLYTLASTTKIMSCYMYYFEHRGQEMCIDATSDDGPWGIGRLINHSINGNLDTVKLTVDGMPRLVFVANRDIKAGDELAYDYGDRTSFAAFPWLKK